MKLIHVKQARSIWIFDLRDLNPKGKDILGDLIDWIKDNYGFAVAPDPENPVVTTPPNAPSAAPGYVFQRGRFQVREEIFIEITTLTLYGDGMVIDTPASTEEADQFANDLLRSASQEYALVFEPAMIRKRMYVSELIVRSDIELERLSPKLRSFAARITEVMPDGAKPVFQSAGLSFWSEPNDSGAHKIFSLERTAANFFAEHR